MNISVRFAFSPVLLACLLALIACLPQTSRADDAVSNFSPTSNPSGAWSYGWEASLGGAFTLDTVQTTVYPGIDSWGGPNPCGSPHDFFFPVVNYNHTGATYSYASGIVQPANLLSLHPGCAGEFSVVRWTAPKTGSFKVVGLFQGIDTRSTSTDVHVLRNSTTSLLSASINGFGAQAAFSFIVSLAGGDTLDFAVGVGPDGGFNADSTGLAVSITPAYTATIQPPIDSDGSSVFNANRGVVPVKFKLAVNGTQTCQLPPATILVTRTSGNAPGLVNESEFIQASDTGSDFRIDTGNCQYVYNLGANLLGRGTYQVQISIDNTVVGSGTFALQ